MSIQSRSVPIAEIKAGNPRLCFSPNRYLGGCHKCPVYVSTTGKPCDSRVITAEGEAELKQIKEKKERIKAIKRELKELKEGSE